MTCREARRLLTRFLEGALERADDRALRKHLPGCETCRTIYRETLESGGRMGRQLREARVAQERQERRKVQRRLAFGAGGGRGRLHALRPFLWTALLIVLLLNLTRGTTPPMLDVTWEAGEVLLPGGHLGATRSTGELARGDWCQTRGASRVRLAGYGTDIVVGAHSQVLVEDARPVRLRLQDGSLSVSGPCTVTTQLGVIVVADGAAQVDRNGEGLDVRCLLGSASVSTPAGTRVLQAGEEERFGLGLLSSL